MFLEAVAAVSGLGNPYIDPLFAFYILSLFMKIRFVKFVLDA